MRALPVSASVVGLLLLLLTLATADGHAFRSARSTLDAALTERATARRAEVESYFNQVASVARVTAHGLVLSAHGHASIEQSQDELRHFEDELRYLGELHPGTIREACILRADGTVVVRMVDGAAVPPGARSGGGAHDAFLGPTLELPVGAVHQAGPHLSPDTGRRVISLSTLLADAGGPTWGMLHFEVEMDSLRRPAPSGSEAPVHLRIVDARTGDTVSDDRDAPATGGGPARSGEPRRGEAPGPPGRSEAAVTIGGQRVV